MDNDYYGISYSGGLGANPPIWLEGHVDMVHTKTLYLFNVFDQMDDFFRKVNDW